MGLLNTLTVSLPVEYLIHEPAEIGANTVLVLTLHGFGMNPSSMLRLTVPAVGEQCVVASLRAPNQHYSNGNPASNEVGYNWGTRAHSALNIQLHHDMVRAALAHLRERFQIPLQRTLLAGFSQPVGLNYRFIGTYPDQVGGILAICGGVPKDWEEPKYHPVHTPILHISRSEDEFFPTATAMGFPDRLRAHATDVEFHMQPGQHRFPSKARTLIQEWMRRKLTADYIRT
jgi:predicted esterase